MGWKAAIVSGVLIASPLGGSGGKALIEPGISVTTPSGGRSGLEFGSGGALPIGTMVPSTGGSASMVPRCEHLGDLARTLGLVVWASDAASGEVRRLLQTSGVPDVVNQMMRDRRNQEGLRKFASDWFGVEAAPMGSGGQAGASAAPADPPPHIVEIVCCASLRAAKPASRKAWPTITACLGCLSLLRTLGSGGTWPIRSVWHPHAGFLAQP